MTEAGDAAGAARIVLQQVGLDLGGRCVLEAIDLVIDGGEPVALAGPSGSGKTVLCLVLAGAMGASRGRVWIDTGQGTPGKPVTHASARRGTTGLIMQTHGLVGGLTAEENVALPLQARGTPRDEVARRTMQALVDVGLRRNVARPVDELSGGERQRVGIARGLAADPVVLVADEPTAELDPSNRERVLELLVAHARRGRVVVIASDDHAVVDVCGRIVVLDRGRVATHLDPSQVTG